MGRGEAQEGSIYAIFSVVYSCISWEGWYNRRMSKEDRALIERVLRDPIFPAYLAGWMRYDPALLRIAKTFDEVYNTTTKTNDTTD